MVRCTFIIGMLFRLWNTHHYKYDSLWGDRAVQQSFAVKLLPSTYASTLILSLRRDGHSSSAVMIGYEWFSGVFCHGCDSPMRCLMMEGLSEVSPCPSMTRKVAHSHRICSTWHIMGCDKALSYPPCWESHAFATNFWSFQKFGGIDVYRLI